MSTQEIYNKDTHLESSFFSDYITSVTETVHYVKLTFKRDPNNVKPEILSLERQIDALSPPADPNLCGMLTYILCFCFLAGIGVVIPWSLNKKRQKEYDSVYSTYRSELDGLLAKLDQVQ